MRVGKKIVDTNWQMPIYIFRQEVQSKGKEQGKSVSNGRSLMRERGHVTYEVFNSVFSAATDVLLVTDGDGRRNVAAVVAASL